MYTIRHPHTLLATNSTLTARYFTKCNRANLCAVAQQSAVFHAAILGHAAWQPMCSTPWRLPHYTVVASPGCHEKPEDIRSQPACRELLSHALANGGDIQP
eukprot:NODE_46_length_2443_cov_193.361390.p7 GENE.NODE_46_length_2443_cov_193.361390~~NODE_46_length_2443_cov_193.361390.p7  ORF type:complete len:101 (+),score=5.97 NODE_46_length_2443_cov_193.361390:1363-1665(+)